MIVMWLSQEHLLIAVDSLCVVLLAHVNVCQLIPRLNVLLSHLNILIQQGDGLVVPLHVSVECYKSLDRLLVLRVALNDISKDGLGFLFLTLSLVKDGKHAHDFD